MTIALMTIAFNAIGQTKRPVLRPVQRTVVKSQTKVIDKNSIIKDSLIQENSEFYKVLYTKPITEKKVDESGLVYKLMSVREAKDKRGGIVISLIVENPLHDDSILIDPSKIEVPFDFYISEVHCGEKFISSLDYFRITKGIRYKFDIRLKSSESIDMVKLDYLRIPEYAHKNSFLVFENVEIDWEGNAEEIIYNAEGLDMDQLKKDNEDFRERLGGLNPILSTTNEDMEYCVHAIGEVKDDWEYDEFRINKINTKKGVITVSLQLNNKGLFRKIDFELNDWEATKDNSPQMFLLTGEQVPYNQFRSTTSDEDKFEHKVYKIGSNSKRNIDMVFEVKNGSRPRYVQLLILYDANTKKEIKFKYIPIKWIS